LISLYGEGWKVVDWGVVLDREMTTGKTAEASAFEVGGTSSCHGYDICLKKKNRGIIIPVYISGDFKLHDNLAT
jgi:hypothetical protein